MYLIQHPNYSGKTKDCDPLSARQAFDGRILMAGAKYTGNVFIFVVEGIAR